MLIGTADSHWSLLPVIRKMAPLVEENLLHTFPRDAGFCLAARIWGNGLSSRPDTRGFQKRGQTPPSLIRNHQS